MEDKWKSANKPPSCTKNPIEHLIPYVKKQEVLGEIKKECLDIYGYDLISECSKRKVCLTKKCMGRELPWKSPTALPYLQELAKTQKIENELLYIETDCNSCPFKKKCTKTCDQIDDYIKRNKTKEPQLISKENPSLLHKKKIDNANLTTFTTNIPWDALSNRRRKVIKMRLYDCKDFKYIAHSLNLNNQARAKYEYYAALTKVSEYAIVREFLKDNMESLTEKQQLVMHEIYYNNKTLIEVAEELTVSKQAIQQMITRVFNKFAIEWPIFVKKRGNRIIYNVPELLR